MRDCQPQQRSALARFIPVILSIAAVIAVAISFIAGAITEEAWRHHQAFENDRALFKEILDKRREYASIRIEEYSAGFAFLEGSVPTDQDYQRLKKGITDAFGNRLILGQLLNVTAAGRRVEEKTK